MGAGAALIPPAKHGGRRREVDVREVVNGLLYVLSTGCQGRAERSAAQDYVAAPSSISRRLICNGSRFKKTLLASEQERADAAAARATWTHKRQPRMRLEPHRIVFLDETRTTTKMTHLRGQCPKGQR